MTRDGMENFQDFWPYYLSQHQSRACRWLHFAGTACALALLAAAVSSRRFGLLALAPITGYAFAWLGHFAFERNRPATFRYPLWSLRGDFRMFVWMILGRLK